jgi:hypothetical protein
MVGDRGYCNARGAAHVVDAGAEVLVRFNRTAMPLQTQLCPTRATRASQVVSQDLERTSGLWR